MVDALLVQASLIKASVTVSASVEKARNGEKFSFTIGLIGHGGGSGPRGRGMQQAGNHFSSSPPMRGGVMQHPFDERHL